MKTAILTLPLALRLATRVALAALLLLLIAAGPARADKCTGAKLKAIAKKEAGLLGCSAKEATKTVTGCELTVSGKFSTAYNKPTGCSLGAPPELQCESTADGCQSAIRAVLPDGSGTSPSKCEATRLKAAGKLASGELGCISTAASKGVAVDSGCISKATGKFTVAFNKVTGCTGDGNASGIQTEVENDCVNNMVDVSGGNFVAITCSGVPTTTTTTSSTTTTTTSSTTTTTAPTCASGGLAQGQPCGGACGGACFTADTISNSGLDHCGSNQPVCLLATLFGLTGVCSTDADCSVGQACGAISHSDCGRGPLINGCGTICPE